MDLSLDSAVRSNNACAVSRWLDLDFLLVGFLLVSGAGPVAGQISFSEPRVISNSVSWSQFTRVADMDGDGDLDVIASEKLIPRVVWWENDGTGAFPARHEWRWGNREFGVIAIADWNLDGKPDLWLSGGPEDEEPTDPDILHIRYWVACANEEGSFDAPIPLVEDRIRYRGVSGDPIVADLNGDGHPDVLTPYRAYYSDASGAFPLSLAPSYFFGQMGWQNRKQVTLSDVDRDGDLDFIVVDPFLESPVLVAENLGQDGFAKPEPLTTEPYWDIEIIPNPQDPSQPALLALARDAESGPATLKLLSLPQDAPPTPVSQTTLPEHQGNSSASWSDLILDPQSGRHFISATLKDPNYPKRPRVSALFEISWTGTTPDLVPVARIQGIGDFESVRLRHLDRDAFPDLLAAVNYAESTVNGANSRIFRLAGLEDGSFDPVPKDVSDDGSQRILFHVGDIDGDGRADILTGGRLHMFPPGMAQSLVLWRNSGKGEHFEKISIPVDCDLFTVVAVADIAGPVDGFGDGSPLQGKSWPKDRLDLLVETATAPAHFDFFQRSFEWWLQDESGRFHRRTVSEPTAANHFSACRFLDWDGDGIKDILYQEPAYPAGSFNPFVFRWMKGEANGIDFAPAATLLSIYGADANPVYSGDFFADIDWDGDLDIIVKAPVFDVAPSQIWAENDGTGAVSTVHRLSSPLKPIDADLDGDGHRDFTDGQDFLLARAGLQFVHVPGNGALASNWQSFPDLDGDGDPDVVVSSREKFFHGFQQLTWFENRRGGLLHPSRLLSHSLPIASPVLALRNQFRTGDIDGDGTPDLVVASEYHPRIEWFRIVPTPTPEAYRAWASGAGMSGHSAGPLSDWDGDGIPNREELAFGSDPLAPDPAHPGRPAIHRAGAGLVFIFQRRNDAAALGLDYAVLHSPDLVHWRAWTGPSEEAPANQPNYRRVRFPVSTTERSGFFKVVVSPATDRP